MRRQLTFIGLLTALLFVISDQLFTQTSNATLGGTISDASGALLPGVEITAKNTGTGIVTTVITNDAGAYQFASLQTGNYSVSAGLAGFQTQTRNGVVLGISQQVRLNFTMPVASVAQSVEVTAEADTLIATSSSSVGRVLTDNLVRELPMGNRNVLDLLTVTPGTGPTDPYSTGYFAGGRLGSVNVTRDGFNVTDSRLVLGTFTNLYMSPDLVEEVRVITTPVDAEVGRGSGQVQLVTRSGTNQFRGSAFWTNRNSALATSNWFNNFRGVPKNYENKNQFGVRLGGPIIRNKTFFFFLVDEQRYMLHDVFVGPVLTGPARQGLFRFFPGVDNQNATGGNPTVDRSGNSVKPPNAAGDLQQFSVFNRDPLRPGYDPTRLIQDTFLARMPLPNDYTIGDGLNTAGIRFTRRVGGNEGASFQSQDVNRDQFNTRIDHNFNPNHKLSVVYSWERSKNMGQNAGITSWPDGYSGRMSRDPRLLNFSFVSTLSSSLVNELRVGWKTNTTVSQSPAYVGRPPGFTEEEQKVETGEEGKEAFSLLPKYNGIPLQVTPTLFPNNFMPQSNFGSTRGSITPVYNYGDTLSWTKGVHAFKMGGELRFGHSIGINDSNLTPIATLGAGGQPVQGIDNIAITGLTGNNQTVARNLLTDLSGSVASIAEAFDLRDPSDLVFRGYDQGVKVRRRDWHTTDYSLFFKDNWKIRPSLTLNVGVAYYSFGVPYEGNGIGGTVTGGTAGRASSVCGIACGSLTTVEFVGKNSPNPGRQVWNDDRNNVAPSIGFSWSLPWFGKDKTVLRAGYGWTYPGSVPVFGTNDNVGAPPGVFGGFGAATGMTYTQAPYLSLANVTLPIPQQFAPLRTVPLDGSRSDSLDVGDANRVSPYIQNFTLELQRQLPRDFTVSVAYIGNKATKLWNGTPLNAVDIFGNTFLDAFNVTRMGGDAPLFNRMLMGLNIPGAGVVDGSTLTGSAALRTFTSTRPFLADGKVGQLADFLNRSTSVTGKGGGFVRNGGLPENFFVLNPQFQNVTLHGNPSNSTYHALQLQLTKRLSHGVASQASYTWSRSLGLILPPGAFDADAALSVRDPKNQGLDKTLLNQHRTHSFTSNGTYELPFGPGRKFMADAPGFLQRLVERWQFGAIVSWTSGSPMSITAPVATIWQDASMNTPNIVGNFSKSVGKVTKLSNAVTYFPGFVQITDPSVSSVTPLNGLSGQFTNKAITDSQGRLLLVNPTPGQVGHLGLNWIEGPALLGFDANLIKRVRIAEQKEFELRVDVVNVLNHPNFGYLDARSAGQNPMSIDTNINSTSFGRITSATGTRKFTLGARLNF